MLDKMKEVGFYLNRQYINNKNLFKTLLLTILIIYKH